MKLTTWIGLLAVCLLPIGARAADHQNSGIIGIVETPNWTVEVLSESNDLQTYVQPDRLGRFMVDLEPGDYVLTPFTTQAPYVGPGQPMPNYIELILGPSKTVKVAKNRFTIVVLPTKPTVFPFYIGN